MREEYRREEERGSTIVDQRMQWFKEYERLGNAKEVCRLRGISRKTFYKWLKRYKGSGFNPGSLVDLPRTPHHSPRQTSETIRAQVVEMREVTGYGPRRLSKELREKIGIRLSERTIWKILKRSADQRIDRIHGSTYETLNAPAQVPVAV